MLFARTLPNLGKSKFTSGPQPSESPEPCSFEIKSARWFSIDDLPPELSKDQRRLIQSSLVAQ